MYWKLKIYPSVAQIHFALKGPITWRASARAEICPAQRAEIFLRLHSEFQPGRNI